MAQAIPAQLSGQPVLILKEDTSRTRGREAQRNNIMAAKIIADTIKSAFGPKGMDKMLVDSFGDVTITSDGATILDEIDVQHPAAKMMVEVAKTTDDEVGDGTTSSVILAGKLLEKAEDLLDKNVHPTIIVEGYRKAAEEALKIYDDIAIDVSPTDREMLKKIGITSMASKAVRENRDYFAELAVDAILKVAEKTDEGYKVDLDDIEVEKKAGESLMGTKVIEGMAIDKEVVHSGMPKRIEDARIALLNVALEVEKTEFDAQIRIESPDQMKAFLDEEERLMRDMADKIADTGAKVVICQKGIDDVVQHFLAKEGTLAVRRAKQSSMEKLAKATGGKVVTNIDDLTEADLGRAKLVEERKLGEDKWVFIEGCENPKSVTILVRGGTEKIVDEAERSLHDALSVVRDVVQKPKVVAGGGAPEMEVAGRLREWGEGLSGRVQLAALDFAEALEVIPTTLAENAGLDPIDIVVELRSRHEKGEKWAGVDIYSGEVRDMSELDVYEPLAVKEQIIKSASEAASMILRIDDVIAAAKPPPTPPPKGPGEGGEGFGEEY
ncbi:MAG: thermosome subunit beta [Candidatus Bathyarchaeia archaeon]